MADEAAAVVRQAGGNPLYAEQYVHVLTEGGGSEGVPATLQALISARIDALPEAEKALAQDAAVVGRVFWTGALAVVTGSDRWTVDERLHALERKAFLRRSRDSSVEREHEYTFAHGLIREAAYAAIPRALRVAKHVRIADWIESLGGAEDHFELVAHHYVSALDLGLDARNNPGSKRGTTAFRRAGSRAASLHSFATAGDYYRRACDLVSTDDPERGRLLLQPAELCGSPRTEGRAPRRK